MVAGGRSGGELAKVDGGGRRRDGRQGRGELYANELPGNAQSAA